MADAAVFNTTGSEILPATAFIAVTEQGVVESERDAILEAIAAARSVPYIKHMIDARRLINSNLKCRIVSDLVAVMMLLGYLVLLWAG